MLQHISLFLHPRLTLIIEHSSAERARQMHEGVQQQDRPGQRENERRNEREDQETSQTPEDGYGRPSQSSKTSELYDHSYNELVSSNNGRDHVTSPVSPSRLSQLSRDRSEHGSTVEKRESVDMESSMPDAISPNSLMLVEANKSVGKEVDRARLEQIGISAVAGNVEPIRNVPFENRAGLDLERNHVDGLSFSKLIVDVIQARDLAISSNVFVVIHFQGSAGETEYIESRNPYWNTNFCFDVDADELQNGQEEDQVIIVTVLSKTSAQTDLGEAAEDVFLGEVVIAMADLEDQFKHTSWFPLSGDLGGGRQASGQVQLNLLWLYSIPKLLKNIKRKEPAERERILSEIKFSKLIVDILDVSNATVDLSQGSPALNLVFQGANASTDEVKLDTDEARRDATKGIFAWNMNFTFDVAEDDELFLEIELIVGASEGKRGNSEDASRSGQVLGVATVWLTDLQDQQKHQAELKLKRVSNSDGDGDYCGTVRLNLLWLYDLRKLLEQSK